jgi:AhpD family alkylhydroperoxidase
MRTLQVGMAASLIAGLVAAQLASAQRAPAQQPAQRAPAQQPAQQVTPQQQMGPNEVFKDIEATIGFVPQFFRVVSDAQLPSFWAALKNFEMNPDTALDGKTKELIGVAVAAQIPCEYCVILHTDAARQHGATEQQIREAVGMAAVTRMGSTLLNGAQLDVAQFRKDTQRMLKSGDPKKQKTAARRAP